jgi:hypothetical protein
LKGNRFNRAQAGIRAPEPAQRAARRCL